MKNRIIIALFGISLFSNISCTDLNEEVIDESLDGSGQAEAVSGAIAPAYGQIAWTWRHTN